MSVAADLNQEMSGSSLRGSQGRQTSDMQTYLALIDRLCERSLNLHEEFLQNQTSAYQSRPFYQQHSKQTTFNKSVFFHPLSADLNSKLSGKCLGLHFLQQSDERNQKNGGWACVTGPELQESTLLGIRLGNQSYLSTFKTIHIARSKMFTPLSAG